MEMNNDVYDEETLEKMYEDLKKKISEEQIENLKKYFNTAGYFYQIVSLKRVLRIYNEQNDEKISEENFLEFAEIFRHEDNCFSILGKEELYDDEPEVKPVQRQLIIDSVLDIEDIYYMMDEEKDGWPYYVPSKDELMKYENELYSDITPQYKALYDFFRKTTDADEEWLDEIMTEIVFVIRSDEYYPSDAIEFIEKVCSVKIKEKNYREFVKLYSDLNNTTRNPWLNGFTPTERYEKCGDKDKSRYLQLGL